MGSGKLSNSYLTKKSGNLYLTLCKKEVYNSIRFNIRGDVLLDCTWRTRARGITISQDLKWTTHATRTQKSVTKMLGVLNRFGSALNTNSRCHILQAFILPKLSHYTSVWCWVSNPVVNAFDTTLQHPVRIFLRQKNSHTRQKHEWNNWQITISYVPAI